MEQDELSREELLTIIRGGMCRVNDYKILCRNREHPVCVVCNECLFEIDMMGKVRNKAIEYYVEVYGKEDLMEELI
jgi:hypothetical protein